MNLEDQINLLYCWGVLLKRRWLVGVLMSGAIVTSILVSLLLPKWYVTTAQILPPQSEGGLDMISRLPSEISGFAGGFLGAKSTGDLWVGILNSQRISDAVIERFDLRKRYRAGTLEDARATLKGGVRIEKAKKGEIISITVEDKDPEMAAAIANAFVEELDRVNRSLVTTAGQRARTFVETRLQEAKEALTRTEEELKLFQDHNRAVKLDDQSKAIIEAIGAIKGKLMAKEVELQTLLSFATPNNPQAELLKSQIEGLREQLSELEEGTNRLKNRSSKDIFIPTTLMPDLALQYVRLLREAKIQETLYGLLTQQYEIARIQEAKDSPTIQTLDIAKVPEKRSRPKRRQIVLLSVMAGSFFSICIAFLLEYRERLKTAEALASLESVVVHEKEAVSGRI